MIYRIMEWTALICFGALQVWCAALLFATYR